MDMQILGKNVFSTLNWISIRNFLNAFFAPEMKKIEYKLDQGGQILDMNVDGSLQCRIV